MRLDRLRNINLPSEKITKDLFLRYVDGDVTPEERTMIRKLLQESDSLRRECGRMEKIISRIKSLPVLSPPERIWKRVFNEIRDCKPRPVWFPWAYRYPQWAKASCVIVGLFILTLIGTVQPLWYSSYDVIVVQEVNGFGLEAETYIVHHNFTSDSTLARESLLALYTVGNSNGE